MSRLTLAAVAGALLAAPLQSQAWKPFTHVHLADVVLRAAQTGTVQICRVDHFSRSGPAPADAPAAQVLKPATQAAKPAPGGAKLPAGLPATVGTKVGPQLPGAAATAALSDCIDYKVHPRLLQALRNQPRLYLAGSMGPDAYPDVATGQNRIHPEGTNGWLRQMWKEAWTGTPCATSSDPNCPDQVLAFVAGFLAHAAADVHAHTYVNYFAGGKFDLVGDPNNAVRHMLLEGYIAHRTPVPSAQAWDITAIAPLGSPSAGYELPEDVARFVASTTVRLQSDYPPDRELDAKSAHLSPPYYFSKVKEGVGQVLGGLDQQEAEFRKRHEDAVALLDLDLATAAWVCKLPQSACPEQRSDGKCAVDQDPLTTPLAPGPSCIWYQGVASVQAGEALAASAALVGFEAAQWPLSEYLRSWSDGIDDAQIAWVKTNHRAAVHLFFNPQRKLLLSEAEAEILDFAYRWLPTVLAGSPQGVQQFTGMVVDATNRLNYQVSQVVDPWSLAIDKLSEMVIRATPLKPEYDHAMTFKQEDVRLNEGMPRLPTRNGQPIDSTTVDGHMGLDGSEGAVFSWWNFAPAYDSVTLMKIALLDPPELNRLLGRLAIRAGRPDEPLDLMPADPPPNVMTGLGLFPWSIDASNQWCGEAPGPAKANLLFASHFPFYRSLFLQLPPAFAGDAPQECNPPRPLSISLSTPVAGPGVQVTISLSKQGTVTAAPGTSLTRRDATTWVYQAPAQVLREAAVSFVARSDGPAPMTAQATLRLAPPFEIVPDYGDTVVRHAGPRSAPPPATGPRASAAAAGTSPPLSPAQFVATSNHLQLVQRAKAASGALLPASLHVESLQAVRFRVVPEAPVRWAVVQGPGLMGDPDAQALRKLGASLGGVDPKALAALAQAQAARRGTRVAARTYTAVPPVQAPRQVTVEALATDGSGRRATYTFSVDPQRPPLAIANLPVKVSPSARLSLQVSPAVPVRYEVVSGPDTGVVGGAEYAALQDRLRPLQRPPPTLKIAPGIPVSAQTSVRSARLAATRPAGPDQLVLAARARDQSTTYVAPAHPVARVEIRAIALDGSGRVASGSFAVAP